VQQRLTLVVACLLLSSEPHEVDIATLDRASLFEYYAKVVLAETAYVPAKK